MDEMSVTVNKRCRFPYSQTQLSSLLIRLYMPADVHDSCLDWEQGKHIVVQEAQCQPIHLHPRDNVCSLHLTPFRGSHLQQFDIGYLPGGITSLRLTDFAEVNASKLLLFMDALSMAGGVIGKRLAANEALQLQISSLWCSQAAQSSPARSSTLMPKPAWQTSQRLRTL